MKITSTNDGGVLIALSAEEIGALLKASKQTDMFVEPRAISENIYKGLRSNTRDFVDELRDRYDGAWIETKTDQFQNIRHKHQMVHLSSMFRLLEDRGGMLCEREAGKHSRIRFLW
jgi:hypothetical protein